MSTRWLLVDDHAIFRAGLRLLLQTRYPTVVLEEASDGAAALTRAEELKPDLIFLDLQLPDQHGLDVARKVLSRSASTKIIVLSAEAGFSSVNEALKIGASAYLLKTSAPEELAPAIRAVLAGQLFLSAEANAAVLEAYRRALTSQAPSKLLLSTREAEVLRLIAEGLRSKEIAGRLDVGVKTVETYRRRLTKKLGCASTAELVRYAMREGIIQP